MKWSFVWSALAVFCCAVASSQSVEPRPLVQVGTQILTTKDLERVKQLLPFERFKTTLGKTRLIDAIYVEYMIAKAKLEQSGMVKATADDVARSVALLEESGARAEIKAAGYSLDAFAERELITRNYVSLISNRTLSNIMGNFLETYVNPLKVDQKDLPASRERYITSRYSLNQSQSPLFVTLRSMLLENAKQAVVLAPKIRSERDFDAVARRYSMVRRDVGGSYTSEYLPSRVTVRELEPEVQIGVLKASKLGLLRVAAPFGRTWLVWLSALPKAVEPGLTASLSVNIVASADPSVVQAILLSNTVPVTWLDQTLEPSDPVIARVGKAELRISEFFIASILEETDFKKLLADAFFDLAKPAALGQYAQQWLENTAVREGLPYGGAGAEYGLLPYIAARAKVSETQLKSAYWQDRREYMYRADQYRVQCTFANSQYASKWRDVAIFAPFNMWGDGLNFPLNTHCDTDGATELLPLPASSRITLTPIAGGYVTAVSRYQQGFYFVALYGFHPDPLIEPFALVRDQVEQMYRTLVAEKQLEPFRAALYARTGAQNRLAEAIKQLEQP